MTSEAPGHEGGAEDGVGEEPADEQQTGGEQPHDAAVQRQFFADQLRALFAAAGRPALKKVASEAAAVSRSVGSDRTVSVQRISDWRSGKRLPASFESIRPVLVVLIRAALDLEAEPTTPGLYSLKQWERWWKVARGHTGPARTAERQLPAVPEGVRPYKGLSAYREPDARLFFGRAHSVRTLVATVVAAHGKGPVIVTGASGVGKSSLVQAGVIPQLCATGDCWPIVLGPGAHPMQRLVAALPALAAVGDRPDGSAPDRSAVAAAVRAEADAAGAVTLLVVVDQIEELFTHCDDPHERDRFLQCLELMSTSDDGDAPALVVATMRSDFYDRAVTHPVLAHALERHSKAVRALDRDDLVEVITAPAKLLGVRLEAGLVDLILHDLGVLAPGEVSGAELPLLSHVLDTMWDTRKGGVLTVAAYRGTGGVRGSVAASAERAWAALDDHDRELARSMLVQLVYVTNTGTDVKMSRPLAQLVALGGDDPARAERVIDHFVSARVLVADGDRVALVHDAVIDAWPRLKSWIQEDRAYAASRQQIEADAANWVENGRNSSLLYQRGRMELLAEQDARFGHAADPETSALSPTARDFLDASRRQVAWQGRRRGGAIAALTLLTITALVMGALAWGAKNRAEDERSAAQFQQIVALSDSMRADDPTTSAHLALLAARLRPDSEVAYSRLLATQAGPLARVLRGHTGPIYGVAVSADGDLLASASDDGTVRLWSLSGETAPLGEPLVSSPHYMASVSFSPDGRYLAAGGASGTVWIWDVGDPAAPRPVLADRALATGAVHNVRFAPDGRTLAVPYDDGSVALVDTSALLAGSAPADTSAPAGAAAPATGQFPVTMIRGHEGGVRTVSFRGDGTVLATASDDRTVRLWDVRDRARPVPIGAPITGFGDVAHSVSFNGDGTLLAASSDDGQLWLFDTADPAQVRQLGVPVPAHTGGVWNIAFLPGGNTLATASWDGTAKLWAFDPADHTLDEITPALTGHGGGVPSLTVTPDGATVVTGGQDANLRVWTMPRDQVPVAHSALTLPSPARGGGIVATGSYGPVVNLWRVDDSGWHRAGRLDLPRPLGGGYVVALSPSGAVLATAATSGGAVGLWDVQDPAHPRPLTTLDLNTRFTSAIAFGPDDRTLVTGSDDFSVQLWDLSDPAAPRPWGAPLAGPTNLVRGVAVAPDGGSLVATSADGSVYAWDIGDRDSPRSVPVSGGHHAGVNGVAFGATGEVMATGGDDHGVVVWDRAADGSFTARGGPLHGHTGTVYSVSVSPDERYVVSGSDDGTVRLWDITDPEAMREVGGPLTDTGVGRWQVRFRPDGTVLAAGGDGVLRSWSLDRSRVIGRICASTSSGIAELLPRLGLPAPPDGVC